MYKFKCDDSHVGDWKNGKREGKGVTTKYI